MNPPATKICLEYYQTTIKNAPNLYQGMDSFLYGAYGMFRRYLRSDKGLLKKAHNIHLQAEKCRELSNNDLQKKLSTFRS
ncbi:hypothetical protein MHK_005541, partial [Candidatus Magnetomorum sp. HK-1]